MHCQNTSEDRQIEPRNAIPSNFETIPYTPTEELYDKVLFFSWHGKETNMLISYEYCSYIVYHLFRLSCEVYRIFIQNLSAFFVFFPCQEKNKTLSYNSCFGLTPLLTLLILHFKNIFSLSVKSVIIFEARVGVQLKYVNYCHVFLK